MEGDLNWISVPLEGAAAGSPVTSFDGRYVYLTHNSNAMSFGHFSVLDTLGATMDTGLFPIYSEFNQTNPFTPPGIYHKPEEGYYDGGQGNTNDIVIWAHSPNPTDSTVGSGASFAFQFPMNYVDPNIAVARQGEQDQPSMPLFWVILGDNMKDWQSTSAPILTNLGRSLYWSVSRSQFRAWVGQAGSNNNLFNRFKTGSPSFGRGNPRYAASPNTPALSSHPTQPMIFAGTASNEFVKMDYLMTEETALVRNTTSKVRARAIVSPDDKYVYFSEFSGILHQASTADLQDAWALDNEFGAFDGEFSLTSDGTMLIVGGVTGKILAYRVAFNPTAPPSSSPTTEPTAQPQPQPTTGFIPTSIGLVPTAGQPTVKPTRSPVIVATPNNDQSRQPTLRPTASSGATMSLVFAIISVPTAALAFLF
jgi:hypothetical protein